MDPAIPPFLQFLDGHLFFDLGVIAKLSPSWAVLAFFPISPTRPVARPTGIVDFNGKPNLIISKPNQTKPHEVMKS